MDFSFDTRTEELRSRLLDFMDGHVYPAEPVLAAQLADPAREPQCGRYHGNHTSVSSVSPSKRSSSWSRDPATPGSYQVAVVAAKADRREVSPPVPG